MKYWWVNQNQTFRQEIDGGYLWSPKRNTDDRRNPFYEFMREVAPGDVVFSFANTRISVLGIVSGYCRESPKPPEFGLAGSNWSQIGWRVDVRWQHLENPIRPIDHIARLRMFLGAKYSPLRTDGNGLQGVYLTSVNGGLANELFMLIGAQAQKIAQLGEQVSMTEKLSPAPEPDVEEWEQRQVAEIESDPTLRETERKSLIVARIGQGDFRKQVRTVERACRITKVDRLEHLVASHVRPWRDSDNAQRLDKENGLLLTPTIDHLFDKGFISFEDTGRLIVSPVADETSLRRMGIKSSETVDTGPFSEGQRAYLRYHRDNVLKLAKVDRRAR